MRKLAFCIWESKDADQLRGNRKADQRLCFRYTDSTIRNFKPLGIFCDCTARFMSELVGNPEDRFSQNEAQIGINMRQIVLSIIDQQKDLAKMLLQRTHHKVELIYLQFVNC